MLSQQSLSLTGSRKRPLYSARPFLLTILAIFIITLLACAKSRYGVHGTSNPGIAKLHKKGIIVQDEECRLVHEAADQCAFIRVNCPDEEAGILSYLALYYCRLPHARPVAFAILVAWLGLLFSTIGIAASDFFCVNLSTIAGLLGMSESMAGVTFLAFGNGSPDVFSTFAAFRTNSASLAMGELIGAASFITAVVAGSMAIIRPFKVARRSFVRDVCFFIVAASFSMGFIWDGKLSLWESITMVGFYVFYVCFVVVWHWWLGRLKARRLRATLMRSHYIMPGGEVEELPEEYHDNLDGPVDEGGPQSTSGVTADDFAALEHDESRYSIEADDNEELRERWLGELSNNMRINKPLLGSRRNTHTPIRPSLVGALEFRAVLSSLQKSRNIQAMPIGLRRYSDDPNFTTAQQQNLVSTTSDPAPRPPYEIASAADGDSLMVTRPSTDIKRQLNQRARAVSTNDLENARLVTGSFAERPVPTFDFGPASPEDYQQLDRFADQIPPSPSISISPPASAIPSRPASPSPTFTSRVSRDRLAPPDPEGYGASSRQGLPTAPPLSSTASETLHSRSDRSLPKLTIPTALSSTPFPPYRDYPGTTPVARSPSLRLLSPSASPESYFPGDHIALASDGVKVPWWWPTTLMPTPSELVSTLFPTLVHWRQKSVVEKLLGAVAAPTVFLLTITLPVVENQKQEEADDGLRASSLNLPGSLTSLNGSLNPHQRSMVSIVDATGSPISPQPKSRTSPAQPSPGRSTVDRPEGSMIAEDTAVVQSPEQLPQLPTSDFASGPRSWNRWLMLVQCFSAPLFIVLVVWANTDLERPRGLIRPTLWSLLFSLGVLALLLTTTTPSRAPRWRSMLCFVGFAVSIAWISSIANEVVGVLKALGVILDMSDAILGLTIFAVGNSLGDLVADVTVARLGFPVMALSACFGGPMLNILLGIGLSGSYMSIKGGRHRHDQHPDRPVHFKPYPIQVSTTLVVSGATLVATLVGLLLAVPWRGWKMDKAIGYGLIALWAISTTTNVAVEVWA